MWFLGENCFLHCSTLTHTYCWFFQSEKNN
uniref:Uncharacterized protein n=1 Tax=Rhizophora mucronata TaxID=61149 RepID=A0A2P2QDA4_RHIMU